VINPWQFEIGQCCVITRRHVATLLELSDEECNAIIGSAKRVAHALVETFNPLGKETPHFHFHVVPRQKGSDWGVGPPQLATFETAGRPKGTTHDSTGDAERKERVQVSADKLTETVDLIRSNIDSLEFDR